MLGTMLDMPIATRLLLDVARECDCRTPGHAGTNQAMEVFGNRNPKHKAQHDASAQRKDVLRGCAP
jgi:hypothetical protein